MKRNIDNDVIVSQLQGVLTLLSKNKVRLAKEEVVKIIQSLRTEKI